MRTCWTCSSLTNLPLPPPPTPRKPRRILRLVGWNLLLIIAGLALVAIAGEAYFRLTRPPFTVSSFSPHFVPAVGVLRKPNTEMRHTNGLDFWAVSRINSLGFLDREPISPERAAASCHISVIGDSFVEARQVPIAAKFHVRLEDLAARELPHLDVTTSAFGIGGTGQINQLPFYDEFARRLRPKLLILVFVPNDFRDNSPILQAVESGLDPERLLFVSAERRADGTIELRLPDAGDYEAFRVHTALKEPPPKSWTGRVTEKVTKIVTRRSYFASWLDTKMRSLFASPPPDPDPAMIMRLESLRQRPRYAALLEGWQPTTSNNLLYNYAEPELTPVFEDAMELTGFALDEFKERAERDGASLIILASHQMRLEGDGIVFERMKALTEPRGIPVIDHYDYIVRQGGSNKDVHWAHDGHWNATGHQWAAEGLLEYLQQNQDICN